MATATQQLDKVQDQVIDVLRRVQEPVVDTVRSVVDKVEDRVPEVDLPYGDKIPTADELVKSGFGFRQRLLDNQHQFAKALLDATAPVRGKAKRPAVRPASKSSPKAA